MNKIFSTVLLLLLTVSITTSVFAQKQKSRDELIKEIATLSNSQTLADKDKAYELSKEFITRFAKDKEVSKVRAWVKGYKLNKFGQLYDNKKYAETFALGQEILTEEPENISVSLGLAYAGFDAFSKNKDRSFADTSVTYSKLTLELMEKGIFPENYFPFNTKDEALAWMYYIIGSFSMEKDIKLGASNLFKATLYDSPIKKTPEPYLMIAEYYEGRSQTMTKDLNAKAKTLTDAEFNAEKAKVDVITEQLMDVYARAYKIADTANHPAKEQIKAQLIEIYKFHKKTDAGFEPYLAYVVTTAFKDPANF